MNKPPIDKEELAIRFGCGALIGAFFGLLFSLKIIHLTFGMLGLIIVTTSCSFGYLAAKYGDSFWYALLEICDAFVRGIILYLSK